jgi:flagellar hook-length control protein FliK
MGRLPGEDANPLPGAALRHAATALEPPFIDLMLGQTASVAGPDLSELMLRPAAPVTIPAAEQTSARPIRPWRMEVPAEPAEEPVTSANGATAGQVSETPEQNPALRAPQGKVQSVSGIVRPNEERSGSAKLIPQAPPALPSRPKKAAIVPATETAQNAPQPDAAKPLRTERAARPAGSAVPAQQKPAAGTGSSVAPVPAAALKTAVSPASTADTQSGASAALATGLKPSVAVFSAALGERETPTPAQGVISTPVATVIAAPALTKTRIDRNGTVPRVEAKNDIADPAPATPLAFAPAHASRAGQHFPAEAPRSVSGKIASAASTIDKSAEPTARPAPPEAPGLANAMGSMAHVLRANPASFATPSLSNHAPGTVSAAFTRMDSAVPPWVLESTPQRLSVGVRDSALGWVEIRTHAATGQISAVLAAGTSEAHAALEAHLPDIRDFLAGQQVRVDQLSSERFSASPGSRDSAQENESRSGRSSHPQPPNRGLAPPAACSDATEESLSYINVRV